jgi:lysozyme
VGTPPPPGPGGSAAVRLRRPLIAVALLSTATAAASASSAGCTKAASGAQTAASNVEEADDVTIDTTPRGVCPSEVGPDGGAITVEGMDTSDYQFTDWDQVARENPNRKFAFVRLSAGLVRVDTRFSLDWPATKRVGLIRGVYQYFKPSQSAVAQADLVVRRLGEQGGLEAGDLPPVIDIETTNNMPPETVSCRIKIWLARVERETKRRPIIYSSMQYKDLLGTELGRYPLWIARYVKTPSVTCPQLPDAWQKWTFWQHTDSARISGVFSNGARDDTDGGSVELVDGGDGGPVLPGTDSNFFDGTLEDLHAFVASTVSSGDVADPPPLDNPPAVPGASMEVGAPIDCADGCCVPAPAAPPP